MKQMSDKVFLDSNIVIYTYSATELNKQQISRDIISNADSFISTQVLQEVSNILMLKLKLNYELVIAAIKECRQNSLLHINTDITIIQACEIVDRYGFSFYDSLIISAALECNCNLLYSEDLQNGQLVLGKLTIINPFR